MKRRFVLPWVLLSLSFVPVAVQAQTNCPDANPYDSAPDDPAINACLARGGVVTLQGHSPGGHEFYYIANSLNLTVSGTTLTSGTAGQHVSIFATNDLYGPMLQTIGANNYTISEVDFAGGVYARTRRGECQGYRDFGSNLVLTGDGFVVRNVNTAGAMCGTGLGVDGSNFEISGVRSYENGIPEDEPHSAPERGRMASRSAGATAATFTITSSRITRTSTSSSGAARTAACRTTRLASNTSTRSLASMSRIFLGRAMAIIRGAHSLETSLLHPRTSSHSESSLGPTRGTAA